MKPNDFIKKHGLSLAKAMVSGASGSFNYLDYENLSYSNDEMGGHISINDLKRLVESYELVEVGLPELKKEMFSCSRDLEYVKNWVLTVSEKLLTEKGIKLKQAISDVESCQ